MKKIIYMVCFGFVLCSTHGATLVDDFESYTIGDLPDVTNGWLTINLTASQEVAVASEESPFTGGSQALHYLDADSSGGVADLRERNMFASPLTNGVFTFDYKAVAAPWYNPSFFIADSSGIVGVLVNIMTGSAVNNRVRYHNGTTMVDVATNSLTLGTWYRAEITVGDLSGSSDTFDMRLLVWNGIAGSEVFNVTGIPFKVDIADMKRIEFGTNAGLGTSGTEIYVDNVQVEPVPLPSALLLADDFESYALGVSMHGFNGWNVINQTTNQKVTVDAVESPFTEGSQSMHYLDADNTSSLGNLRVRNTLSESHAGGVFRFDYKVDATPWLNPSFFVLDSSGTVGVLVNIITGGSTANRVRYHNGSTMVDVATNSLTLGAWYRTEVTIGDVSGSSDTFDIRLLKWDGVSGTELFNVTGLVFKADIADINAIEFGTNTGLGSTGAELYVDNVLITSGAATEIGNMSIGQSGTDVVLGWQGSVLGTYAVQRKLNLTMGSWSNVIEGIPGIDGAMWSTNNTGESQAFYRVIAQ